MVTGKNVTFVKLDKQDVCLDPDIQIKMQKRSKVKGKSEKKRFTPNFDGKSSYVGKVLEVVPDPYPKSAMDCKDRCYRLAGQIITLPQSKDEEKLMNKAMWNYMMKKADNNLTYINHNHKVADIHAGGETNLDNIEEVFSNMNSDIKDREALYPNMDIMNTSTQLQQPKSHPTKTYL